MDARQDAAAGPVDVARCDAGRTAALTRLFALHRLAIESVPAERPIPGSYWGEPEAGLVGAVLYLRGDTPVHSALHEGCHFVCMSQARRARLDTDAGGDHAEENAVCYLSILLADEVPRFGHEHMLRDMDAWGYTFRLGSARAWFERDAEHARDWLETHRLVDAGGRPSTPPPGAASARGSMDRARGSVDVGGRNMHNRAPSLAETIRPMGNSLQDQLLELGLVSEEQLAQARKPSRGGERPSRAGNQAAPKRRRGRRRGRAEAAASPPPPAPPASQSPSLEERNAKIRALLDAHRQNDETAEIPYNFVRDSRIKKIYVTEAQRRALLAGELAVAGYRRIHHLLPRAVADEILALREEIFVHRAEPDAAAGEDENAVPDDLVW